MDDITIFESIRKGDAKVFESLFRVYYNELCHFAYRYLKDWDLAEETVQDVFYQIWKKHDQLNIVKNVKAYLYQSVKNSCLQIFKHKLVEKKYVNNFKIEGRSEAYEPTDALEHKEIVEKVERVIQSLPERCRDIFMLNRFEGLKYQEIADRLAISIKTVEANMGKALKVFRESFGSYVRNSC